MTGPAGVGKTRLAIEAARRLAAPGGVWLVRLDAADAATPVPQAVAEALRVTGGEPALAERLASADTVLVLDNCEHIVGAIAELIGRLLDAVPRLRGRCPPSPAAHRSPPPSTSSPRSASPPTPSSTSSTGSSTARSPPPRSPRRATCATASWTASAPSPSTACATPASPTPPAAPSPPGSPTPPSVARQRFAVRHSPSAWPSCGPSAPTSTPCSPGSPSATPPSASASPTASAGPGSCSATGSPAPPACAPRCPPRGPSVAAHDRATALLLAGWLEASAGDVEQSGRDLDEALELAGALGAQRLRADAERHLAFLRIQQGRPHEVLALAGASLAVYRRLGLSWASADEARRSQDRETQVYAMDALAARTADAGEPDAARALLAAADELAATIRHLVDDPDRIDARRARAVIAAAP
ncbi:MAG TPA: hypothetical protein VL738_12765 [Dactylosporangium sp.]|nr:hypothetical protein [Dactylosporangium sp.]